MLKDKKMKDMEDIERRVVLIGTWFYDKTIPKKLMPAKYSYIRYDDLDELVESVPILKLLMDIFIKQALAEKNIH
jgi:hypothetical protein